MWDVEVGDMIDGGYGYGHMDRGGRYVWIGPVWIGGI